MNRVRETRLALGMQQQALAKKAGITRQTLSLIEKDEYNPSLKLCLALCRELGKTLDELFWEDEEDEHEKTDA